MRSPRRVASQAPQSAPIVPPAGYAPAEDAHAGLGEPELPRHVGQQRRQRREEQRLDEDDGADEHQEAAVDHRREPTGRNSPSTAGAAITGSSIRPEAPGRGIAGSRRPSYVGAVRALLRHASLRALVVVAAVVLGVVAAPASAAPNTTVSFTFDDGRPSQLAAAQELVNRGMNATFFIITSQVGLPGVMSLSDLNKLKADGMEIGAHTVLHREPARRSRATRRCASSASAATG